MDIEELRKTLKEKRAIFGTDRTLKFLKNNLIETVILSRDGLPNLTTEIKKINPKISVVQLDMSKDELKEICNTPFDVSVIGVLSEKRKSKSK
jgi:ribosomal protein L30E